MRNNPFELVDTISFLGDEPCSSRVWAHTMIAQSMIMHNGMLPPPISHPRQRNNLTLPTIRLVAKLFGVFILVRLLDLAVGGVANFFTKLIV